jgi:hypothetical protein
MKSNYLDAIRWIDDQLTKPTREIKVGCETIHDLNFSLKINRNHILENSGQLSYSAFGRTKKIKDFLQLSK